MTRAIAVLRPEPGNGATAARVEALGLAAIRLPLFAARPVAWRAPDAGGHDALLLTSANAVRHGGAGLAGLRALPVLAVGAATAEAARGAGFAVVATGARGAGAMLAEAAARDLGRVLHLGGRDRTVEAGGPVTRAIAVYASEALAVAPGRLETLRGAVALLHSARAARRLRELLDAAGIAPGGIRVAVLSPAVAAAAGDGWGAVAVADAPTDPALLDAAARLAD